MSGAGAWHVREEVLTGAAVESAGRPPAVSGREGSLMESVTMPAELVERWQLVYSAYLTADRLQGSEPNPVKMARLARDVASVWRDMASVPGMPWWLVAPLTTSAEAMERQAKWDNAKAVPARPTEPGSGPRPLHPGEGWYGSLGSEGPAGGGGQ